MIAGFEAPASQVTKRELECLIRHAKRAQTIVEIGCFEGSTTLALAENTAARVYSIDPFLSGRLGVCYGELIAKYMRWKRRVRNVQFLKGLSHDVAPTVKDRIDFIFIDADHNYEAIKRDWDDWFPKLRPGGFIALHDCRIAENSPAHLGTMKFYEQDIPGMDGIEEVEKIDSLVVFKAQANGRL